MILHKLIFINFTSYGPQNHEKLGADYLRKLKIPESICYLVENHFTAKRYLVFKVLFNLNFKILFQKIINI